MLPRIQCGIVLLHKLHLQVGTTVFANIYVVPTTQLDKINKCPACNASVGERLKAHCGNKPVGKEEMSLRKNQLCRDLQAIWYFFHELVCGFPVEVYFLLIIFIRKEKLPEAITVPVYMAF